MPFSLSPVEMVFVLAVLLLLFGAKRLPDLGSGLGRGIREFKRSIKDVNEEIQRPDDTNRIQDPANRAQVSQTAAEAEAEKARRET